MKLSDYNLIITPAGFRIADRNNTINEEEVAIAEKWLEANFTPSPKYSYSLSSYLLKHRCERETNHYITNGAMIQAMLNLGYDVKERNGDGCAKIKWKYGSNNKFCLYASVKK